jgi:hypothetical protein
LSLLLQPRSQRAQLDAGDPPSPCRTDAPDEERKADTGQRRGRHQSLHPVAMREGARLARHRRQPRASGCWLPLLQQPKVWPGFNDMATTRPDLAAEFHPTKNGDLTPETIVASTWRRLFWKCACGNEWPATGESRAKRGRGCRKCARYLGFDCRVMSRWTAAACLSGDRRPARWRLSRCERRRPTS